MVDSKPPAAEIAIFGATIDLTWRSVAPSDFPNYPGSIWGPESAEALIAQAGRRWLQPLYVDLPEIGN